MTAKAPRMARPNWPLCGLADPGESRLRPAVRPAFAPPCITRFTIVGKTLRCVRAGAKQIRHPKNKKHRGAIGPAVQLFPGSVENPGE